MKSIKEITDEHISKCCSVYTTTASQCTKCGTPQSTTPPPTTPHSLL